MHLTPLVTASLLTILYLPPSLAIPARLVLKKKTPEPYGEHISSGPRYGKPVCPPYTVRRGLNHRAPPCFPFNICSTFTRN
ncbi:hypothetical protein BJX62DRAFT_214454 [Aspergillus germanicus]